MDQKGWQAVCRWRSIHYVAAYSAHVPYLRRAHLAAGMGQTGRVVPNKAASCDSRVGYASAYIYNPFSLFYARHLRDSRYIYDSSVALTTPHPDKEVGTACDDLRISKGGEFGQGLSLCLNCYASEFRQHPLSPLGLRICRFDACFIASMIWT